MLAINENRRQQRKPACGQCGGTGLQCAGTTGQPNTSLFEWNINASGTDWYDVSYVDAVDNPIGVSVSNAMLFLFGGIAIAMWFFTSLLMQNVLGYSALDAGLGQTPAAVMFVTAECRVL